MLATWLTGCAAERSERYVCPPLVGYSTNFGQRAAVELQSLPKDSAIAQMLGHYLNHRDSCRALAAKK